MKILLLSLLALFVLTISFLIGDADLSLNELLHSMIFWDIRLPRTLTAFFVGGALGLSGLLLQLYLKNPLAEPYTLGLSGGATLGALAMLFVGLSPLALWLPFGAATGAFAVLGLMLLLVTKRIEPKSLILLGVLTSLFCGSLVVLLFVFFDPTQLQVATFWLMGQCGTERDALWSIVAAAGAVGIIFSYLRSTTWDGFLVGEEALAHKNQAFKRAGIEIIILVTVLTAASVASMGLVGFVGLIAPHISNILTRSRRIQKNILPSYLIGGMTILIADIIGRVAGGGREVPAGSLIALIGAPTLAWLLLRRSNVTS